MRNVSFILTKTQFQLVFVIATKCNGYQTDSCLMPGEFQGERACRNPNPLDSCAGQTWNATYMKYRLV